MSFALILIPTACYAIASLTYAWHRNWPLAVVYAGYSFANVGLLALDLKT